MSFQVGDEVIINGLGWRNVPGVVTRVDVTTPFGICCEVERHDGTGRGLFEPRYLRRAGKKQR